MLTAEHDYSKQLKELDRFIDSLSDKEGKLVVVLHKAQDLIGYLPVPVQNHIANKLMVPSAKVYGVVTFYSYFNLTPKGKYKVSVCMGTACFVRTAQAVLDEFEKLMEVSPGATREDMMFSLDGVRCVGACGLAPVVTVNGKVYGRVTVDDVKKIVEEYVTEGGAEGE